MPSNASHPCSQCMVAPRYVGLEHLLAQLCYLVRHMATHHPTAVQLVPFRHLTLLASQPIVVRV